MSCSLDDEGDDGDNEAVGEFERPSAERPGGCPLVITGTKAICGSLSISSMKSHLKPLLPGGPMTPGRLAMTGKDTEKPKSKFA